MLYQRGSEKDGWTLLRTRREGKGMMKGPEGEVARGREGN